MKIHNPPPPEFCQEVHAKITCYLLDSSAIHPYLNRSSQPMEAVGDGVDPIPGQTLLSKRQCGSRGHPYVSADTDIPACTYSVHVPHLHSHMSSTLPDQHSAVLQLFEIQHRGKDSASRSRLLGLRLKSQTSCCV